MSDGAMVPALIVGFVIVFPLFWLAVIWSVARFGGWMRLASSYLADGPASGETFRFSSAQLGYFASYRNCLTITVSSSGLHLKPFILFRFSHQPLFIPWQAVVQIERRNYVLFSSLRLSISGFEGARSTRLTLYGRGLIDSIGRHAPADLTGQ